MRFIRANRPSKDNIAGEDLYAALHERCSTALCLSGGGIRSASFALGVIEALAVHPRPAMPYKNQQAPQRRESLLTQFNYLSTVSGGGYIGSWLSAYIARASFPEVWKMLVRLPLPSGRRAVSRSSWLRSYSNYLTRTGLFSAHTWAALSLYRPQPDAQLAGPSCRRSSPRAVRHQDRAPSAAFWGSVPALVFDFPRFSPFIVAGVNRPWSSPCGPRCSIAPSRDPGTITSEASETYGRHSHPAGHAGPAS